MAIVVIGGHSRSVGKTSVVAGLIRALPERRWIAVKITQYGHGICSADGSPCDCATDDHSWAITEEVASRQSSVRRSDHRPPIAEPNESDSARFLAAGAQRSLWVRTRIGMLAEAMPRLREELKDASNVIIESNSVLRFLKPDLYLTVLDPATADFKDSAREFLDRASAVVLHQNADTAKWKKVSLKPVQDRPVFHITPPEYVTPQLLRWVRERLSIVDCRLPNEASRG
jgi:molybdopterin-guanine dinucleotide biosynthesis protein